MASLDLSNPFRIKDKRRGAGTTTATSTALISAGNGKDVTAMRARLTAISAATYTVDALNHMTVNDMRYAILLNDDPASGVNG